MQLVQKSTLIETVADRVRATYLARGNWSPMVGNRDPQQIVAQLEALPVSAGEDEIAAIVGDSRFTTIICDECATDVPVAVRIGTEVHHPIDERQLCMSCLQRALTLAQSAA